LLLIYCTKRQGTEIYCTKRESTEIKGLGRQSIALKVDVTKSESVTRMVDRTLKRFRKIDILVNNAGIIKVGNVVDITEKDWDEVLAVNLRGVFLCSKAVAPHMIEQRSGKIVNISSTAGRRGLPGRAHYHASKFAVIGFTQCLALELAPHNINVNCVCPGVVDTYMHRQVLAPHTAKIRGITEDEVYKRMEEGIPLQRLQTPEDIGNTVAFLVSEDAKNITGQSINVNGGSVNS